MTRGAFEESLKFYGDRQRDEKKCTALNVQYSAIPKKSVMTVNVEMAKLTGATADWENKIYLQLSQYELRHFCELLFGLRKTAEFKYHGAGKNKGLTIHNNGAQGVMLVISEAGITLQHLLSHDQRIELGAFVIRRLALSWQVSVSDVLAILRQSVAISKTRETGG
ncbi:hypothetical protein [Escherichia coli]|uniref:hypothetical protein n=1 Tax=Escherichia coli TaxID=562 RepID=UPI0020A36F04|nr:hypothetical protein ECTOK1_P11330 [Escherichia coli]